MISLDVRPFINKRSCTAKQEIFKKIGVWKKIISLVNDVIDL